MTDERTSTAPPQQRDVSPWPQPVAQGRFVPGTILASRYRVVALVGQGGMGEVYRADDLTLGQPVALKLLPPGVAGDADRLARFRSEVRTARQVSHPNVCRVYDIGEAEGYHFLSMEYVDGEDLASLLRRIGRFPQDKGVEIARQLCAGLAAAHDRGVLHRDLKPANVLIDGRGHARIADFGIAAMAGSDDSGRLAGTPPYLAPEQLAGQPASIKSDIFALGLVLHEIFTGKAVFAPGDLLDIARAHRERAVSGPTTPSQLDPAIDRVIARCLEPDPDARPASALRVSAALPGGDQLEAALARGETPAPEVVAAAGGEGALRPRAAVSALGTALAVLALVVWISDRTRLVNVVPLPLTPDVLQDRAEHIVAQLGYTDRPRDVTTGFSADTSFTEYIRFGRERASPWQRARRGQPSAIRYWYRRSPGPLVGESFYGDGRVYPSDPPQEGTVGMMIVQLDTRGRLLRFFAVPPRERTTAAEPDWAPLFAAAGFDRGAFRETQPRLMPQEHADVRRAWDGVYPDSPDVPIRIEAAGANGRAFYFGVIEPWMDAPAPNLGGLRVAGLVGFIVFISAALLAIWLVARNVRLGRGDIAGATRVGYVMFALSLGGGLLGADYSSDAMVVIGLVARLGSWAITAGVLSAILYLALEPPTRRRWPELLIGWTRFTRGRLRDPRVGAEMLLGVLAGSVVLLLTRSPLLIADLAGLVPDLRVENMPPWVLDGGRAVAARLLRTPVSSALTAFAAVFALLTLTLLLRRQWIAVAVAVAVAVWFLSAQSPTPLLTGPFVMLGNLLFWVLLLRVGLLAHITAGTVIASVIAAPVTLDPSAWYAPSGWAALGIVVALAVYAFHTSLGSHRVLRSGMLDG